jgi:predicted DNA-binding protein
MGRRKLFEEGTMTTWTIRMPEELKVKLQILANESRRSLSSYVRMIFQNHVSIRNPNDQDVSRRRKKVPTIGI